METAEWAKLPAWRLVASDGVGEVEQRTVVRVGWGEKALWVRFECEDRDAWSRFARRDDPLWEEEAVEVFLAAGAATPATYFELQVSPKGVLFDARVDNPHGDRRGMVTDASWDCPGLRWGAGPLGRSEDWWAALAIPWPAIGAAEPPRELRANFYRIERPRDRGAAELSALSPTLVSPPDFHRPARFALLRLVG